MDKFNWNLKCRLCGIIESETIVMLDMFAKEDFINKLYKVLPGLADDALLPKRICYRCHYKVEEYSYFQDKCTEVQDVFKKELNTYKENPKQIKTPSNAIDNKKVKTSNAKNVEDKELKPLRILSNKTDNEDNNQRIPVINGNCSTLDSEDHVVQCNEHARTINNNRLHTTASTASNDNNMDTALVPDYLMVTKIPLAGTVYTCLHCEQTFVSQPTACKHRCEQLAKLLGNKVSEENYSISSKSTSENNTIDEEFPYKCEICNQCFNRNASLISHQATHIETIDYDSDKGSAHNDDLVLFGQRRKRKLPRRGLLNDNKHYAQP